MDLHINDLIFEEGFIDVKLEEISFRNIDQEFIIIHSDKSHGSILMNNLYYCYIKPYEGLFFRLIGVSDEDEYVLKVDEDKTEVEDIPYDMIANETISKVLENGDLISNQLIVNIPFDYYYISKEIEDLVETRNIVWLDDLKVKNNPDVIKASINNENIYLRLIKVSEKGVIAETKDGKRYLCAENGTVSLL